MRLEWLVLGRRRHCIAQGLVSLGRGEECAAAVGIYELGLTWCYGARLPSAKRRALLSAGSEQPTRCAHAVRPRSQYAATQSQPPGRYIILWRGEALTQQACEEAHSQEGGSRFDGLCCHHYQHVLNGFAAEVRPCWAMPACRVHPPGHERGVQVCCRASGTQAAVLTDKQHLKRVRLPAVHQRAAGALHSSLP